MMSNNNNNNYTLLSFWWLKWCNFILYRNSKIKTPKFFSFLYFPTITHAHSAYRFSSLLYFSFPKYLPLISNKIYELGVETYISEPSFGIIINLLKSQT